MAFRAAPHPGERRGAGRAGAGLDGVADAARDFESLLWLSAPVYVDRVRTALLGEKNGIEFPVTVSVGVAQYKPDMATGVDLMAAADRALYRAKKGGRNNVAVADVESEDAGEHSVLV